MPKPAPEADMLNRFGPDVICMTDTLSETLRKELRSCKNTDLHENSNLYRNKSNQQMNV